MIADRRLVLFRDPEEHADHAHRHLGAEIGHEVEPSRADERVEACRAELAHERFERVHLLRGEHAGQQSSVHGVYRRILEDDHAGWHLEVGFDQFEDRTAPGDVRVAVLEPALDVVVAADGKEVVPLVVVER